MQFEILSDPANLKIVRKKVREAIDEYDYKSDKIDEIILAVDEAVQNIIRYAYDMAKDKKISFKILKDDKILIFEIRDFGKQVPLEKIQSRDLDDVRPGGLGVHFIKSIAKDVKFEHQNENLGGTKLILKF